MEGDSEHTIARGIRRAAEERALDLPRVTNFEALKGRGVWASHKGMDVSLGGPRPMSIKPHPNSSERGGGKPPPL